MATEAIRFESVEFAYRRAPVFAGLNLIVAAQEMTAILGPNGTGKTTFLRLAAGSLSPRAGRVALFGRDVRAITPRERARALAVVPQESRPVFDFSAREVVLMGRAPHLGLLGLETPRDLEVARAAMERTDIAGLGDRLFMTLSGGERQRVVLARALAQEPRVLLLDEPTAFLDLKHRLAVYELLALLRREAGLTLVIASHDLDLAARYCDRLVLLDRGGVAADGPPDDVMRPEKLRLVYGVEADVRRDPATGRPWVVPLRPC